MLVRKKLVICGSGGKGGEEKRRNQERFRLPVYRNIDNIKGLLERYKILRGK